MLEKKLESKILIDSKNLFNHLIDFRDTEDCSNDDEFIIKLYYNDAVYLIDLIDSLHQYFGNYTEIYNCLCDVFEQMYVSDEIFELISDEHNEILNQATTYLDEKCNK